jgi:3-hydroxyacyl-CoA dehydrogenase
MGPFELTDYVGLDTCKFILDGKFDKLKWNVFLIYWSSGTLQPWEN